MVTLVLLPGLDGSGELFEPLQRHLDPGLSVQVVRYPLDATLGYEALLTTIKQALPPDAPLVVVGESFSGPLAIRLAAAWPDRVRGLVVCCSFARSPRQILTAFRAILGWMPFGRMPSWAMVHALLGSHRQAAPALKRVLATLPDAVIRSRLHAVATVDAETDLRRVRCPVLVVEGTQDRLIPSSVGRSLQSIKPDLSVCRLAGPHGLLQAKPREAADAIQAFVHRIGHPAP